MPPENNFNQQTPITLKSIWKFGAWLAIIISLLGLVSILAWFYYFKPSQNLGLIKLEKDIVENNVLVNPSLIGECGSILPTELLNDFFIKKGEVVVDVHLSNENFKLCQYHIKGINAPEVQLSIWRGDTYDLNLSQVKGMKINENNFVGSRSFSLGENPVDLFKNGTGSGLMRVIFLSSNKKYTVSLSVGPYEPLDITLNRVQEIAKIVDSNLK